MFLSDTWKAPAEIAPSWLWAAFLIVGLAVSLLPLVAGIKIFRRVQRLRRIALYTGIVLTLCSGSFVAACRPVVAKVWQWGTDLLATVPSFSEAGSSFGAAVTPFIANLCGVALLFFILYVLLEEF